MSPSTPVPSARPCRWSGAPRRSRGWASTTGTAARARVGAGWKACAHASGRPVGRAETLEVLVVDDGHGGASADGSGLKGLRARVEALDGTLGIASPAGGPTMLRAELPCAS